MFIKQVSVFIENRAGRLADLLEILARNHVNLIALSLADTAEYGMMRMVVSDAETAIQALKAEGMSAMLTDVICVRVDHAAGSLNKAMKNIITEVGIEYMYAFSIGKEALNVIKFSEPEKAAALIKKYNIGIWDAGDIKNI